MMMHCWICGAAYEESAHCPSCGPPEPWGPTTEDYNRIRESCRPLAGQSRDSEGDDSKMSTALTSGPEATSSQGTPCCRHGVPYTDSCTRCEFGMLRDAVDDMVSEAEYRQRWGEP